jgi:hypothetical protein
LIVLGVDTHKRSHTVAAVAAPTGELLGEQTVAVGQRRFGALLRWARSLDNERVWALEDCRHVSGSLERFLIERGERVVRIPTHLTAKERKRGRQRVTASVTPDATSAAVIGCSTQNPLMESLVSSLATRVTSTAASPTGISAFRTFCRKFGASTTDARLRSPPDGVPLNGDSGAVTATPPRAVSCGLATA